MSISKEDLNHLVDLYNRRLQFDVIGMPREEHTALGRAIDDFRSGQCQNNLTSLMSDLVKRLKWLASPDAARISDDKRINEFVIAAWEAAEEIERLQKAHETERARCITICESWIGAWQKEDPKILSARTWAISAVEDIAELIRDGHDPFKTENQER